MFYSPEILSQKNKTELSLVYYLSTTKNVKKAYRKEIVNLDLNIVLDKIKNPKTPFALRLYSYLLNGIVKIWLIKVEHYKEQTKNMFITKKKSAVIPCKIQETNVNLRVLDYYITEIQDESNSLKQEIGSIEEILCDNIVSPFDVVNNLNKANNSNSLFINEIIDNNFDMDCNQIISSDFENNITKRIKRNPVDQKTQLKSDEVYSIKAKKDELNIPILVKCTTSVKFEEFLSKIAKQDGAIGNLQFNQDFSIEDPRISSSTSQEKNSLKIGFLDHEDTNFNQFDLRISKFYNILLEASKGTIVVRQFKPFGVIEIITELGTEFFN